MKTLIQNISNDKLLTILIFVLLIILVVAITAIIIVAIVQHGKTKRAGILSEKSSPDKKKEIIEKQLENEVVDKQDNNKDKVIEYIEKAAEIIKK